MPNTTGATWPTLAANKKAKASEVESKFDWSEHNLWPHSAGSLADAEYDLGRSATRWRHLWLSGGINPTTAADGIAIGTTSVINSSTAFEIAGAKAFLMPRMTQAEKNALTATAGMIVYDSTLNLFQLYENGAWVSMGNPVQQILQTTASITIGAGGAAGITSTVVTINSVSTAKAFVMPRGIRFTGAATTTSNIEHKASVVLESSTQVRAYLSHAGGDSSASYNIDFTVVEYT